MVQYQHAEFLMFIQHVRYAITHISPTFKVWDSDFTIKTIKISSSYRSYPLPPGVGTCLTDPQILTSPYVCYQYYITWRYLTHYRQLGNDLFGDGNLGEAFVLFPIQHRCNKYCQWFELETPSKIFKRTVTGADTKKSKGKGKQWQSIVPTGYSSD